MSYIIKNGRVIDPSRGIDEIGNVSVRNSIIVDPSTNLTDAEEIDARGLWIVPGLIDAHVHLREPGGEQKETIATGLKSAAAGGFTAVVSMPNTSPPNATPSVTKMIIENALALGGTRVYPMAAATVDRAGKSMGNLDALVQAGAMGFSDDGSAVVDDLIMEQVLLKCRELKVPFSQHAEDPSLSAGGALHDGAVSSALGVKGWSSKAEWQIVKRDISLAKKLDAQLHVQHISTKQAIDLVRKAKAGGLRVSAEVTPHHLHLTDDIALEVGTQAKVCPPLRPKEHVDACRAGLRDGTIDMVATDHAPHTAEDKQSDFHKAAFGMVGLEISLPLMLLLVDEGLITPLRLIEAMSTKPAHLLGLPGGTLEPGAAADITLIDPDRPFVIKPELFVSKGRNTPFAQWKVPGRAVRTIVAGKTVFNLA
jgi:dihydroorotase